MTSKNRIEEAICKSEELKDGEMREVKVGKYKALLCKVNGEIYATSHLCTHYKAPLAKGTLSKDGRVMCPWHGACFNVKTGDIEDAPAFDSLQKYHVRIDNGMIYVSATQDSFESGKRVHSPTIRKPLKDRRTVVIVGGGPAALSAAQTLREEKYEGRIVCVTSEPHYPIDRVKLSKSLQVDLSKILLRPESYYIENQIEFIFNKTVTDVNPFRKYVILNQSKCMGYDSIIIATGGTPKNFWPETQKMGNVFLVRTMKDSEGLYNELKLKPKPRVLVVGSSFIGMEAAAVLAKEASSLIVVGMEKVPFERVLGLEVGRAMQNFHESKGIVFKMSSMINNFESDSMGKCCAAILKTGERIECDIVVLGTGVTPNTDCLKKHFPLERDGGITVRENMQIHNFQDVYAVGDIARYPYHLPNGTKQRYVRIEHWNVAIQQGRVAALSILGKKEKLDIVPFFWTAQWGKNIRYCGHAESFDEVYIEGSLEDLVFVAYYIKSNVVIAVSSLGKDPIVAYCSELMRLGRMPLASEIKNGKSVLHVPLEHYTPHTSL